VDLAIEPVEIGLQTILKIIHKDNIMYKIVYHELQGKEWLSAAAHVVMLKIELDYI
jgi:hypothetical protein